jgi:predicted metalloprotease
MHTLIVRCLFLAGLATAAAGADIPGLVNLNRPLMQIEPLGRNPNLEWMGPFNVRDIEAKVAQARPYLKSVFQDFFPNRNPPAPFPEMVAYTNEVVSGCGTLGPNNAHYCSVDNKIYYDDVFLMLLANSISRSESTLTGAALAGRQEKTD